MTVQWDLRAEGAQLCLGLPLWSVGPLCGQGIQYYLQQKRLAGFCENTPCFAFEIYQAVGQVPAERCSHTRVMRPLIWSWPLAAPVRVRACSVVSGSVRPVDCSPSGSSVHGILQARILE